MQVEVLGGLELSSAYFYLTNVEQIPIRAYLLATELQRRRNVSTRPQNNSSYLKNTCDKRSIQSSIRRIKPPTFLTTPTHSSSPLLKDIKTKNHLTIQSIPTAVSSRSPAPTTRNPDQYRIDSPHPLRGNQSSEHACLHPHHIRTPPRASSTPSIHPSFHPPPPPPPSLPSPKQAKRKSVEPKAGI